MIARGMTITDDAPMPWMKRKKMSQAMLEKGDMNVGELVSGEIGDLSLRAAYDAPFPDKTYKAGPLIMPQLVPISLDDPAREANLKSAQQIQGHFARLGIPMWGSRAEQVQQTVAKFSQPQLVRAMKLIFEADKGLRSARPDDRIVMEQFVLELTA